MKRHSMTCPTAQDAGDEARSFSGVKHRMRRMLCILGLMTLAHPVARQADASTLRWNTGSGVWDDATTGNWNPPQIPVSGDVVRLDYPSGGSVSIAFASTNLQEPNALGGLFIENAGGGQTTLEIGTGDRLMFNQVNAYSWPYGVTLTTGGVLRITGGIVSNQYAGGWHDFMHLKGGAFLAEGGEFFSGYFGHIFFSDSPGQNVQVTFNGGRMYNYGPGAHADIWDCFGNVSVALTNNGSLEGYREFFIGRYPYGNAQGIHTWSIANGGWAKYDLWFHIGGPGVSQACVTVASGGRITGGNELDIKTNGVLIVTNGGYVAAGHLHVNDGLLVVDGENATNYCGFELWIGSNWPDNRTGACGRVIVNRGYLRCRSLRMGQYDVDVGQGGGSIEVNAGGTIEVSNQRGGIVLGHPDAVAHSTFILRGGAVNSMWSAMKVDRNATFRGYGAVNCFNCSFDVNGRVIADGMGTETNLDLSLLYNPTNSANNTSSNGWYALNKGRLVLRQVTVAAGDSTVYWGDTGPGDPDLANSVRIDITGATAGGAISGALLAPDRSDVPPGLKFPVGIWDLQAVGFGFASAVVRFRYDDMPLASEKLDERLTRVRQYTGGTWRTVTASIDTVNKTITTVPLSSLGLLAVDGFKPAGTVVFLK